MERASEDIWADSAEKQLQILNDTRHLNFLLELSPARRKLGRFLNASGNIFKTIFQVCFVNFRFQFFDILVK